MIQRTAESELIKLAAQFKAVAVTGPRQSGKTTLVRKVFTQKTYVNLENPDLRKFAIEDPRGFLLNYPDGAILDEIQRTPDIFSYLQQILDEHNKPGMFVLTGSNNFLLQENISQSLAGRVGYLFLLPLSLSEINSTEKADLLMFKGGYPELYNQESDISKFYQNYIRTYIERDVRMIKNITDLFSFERFVRLCAGRIGQLLNLSNLAIETGIDAKTASSWLSVLETSFIVFRLQPFYMNFNKRIVKMPKLYFYDTGLASALLGLENPTQIMLNPFRGSLFENLVVLEMLKNRFNAGKQNNLFFWRDNTGNEIDLLIDNSNKLIPIEIKSGQTISSEMLKGLEFWQKLLKTESSGYLVYAGELMQLRSNGIKVVPFQQLNLIQE
jgi:hypothetical protein